MLRDKIISRRYLINAQISVWDFPDNKIFTHEDFRLRFDGYFGRRKRNRDRKQDYHVNFMDCLVDSRRLKFRIKVAVCRGDGQYFDVDVGTGAYKHRYPGQRAERNADFRRSVVFKVSLRQNRDFPREFVNVDGFCLDKRYVAVVVFTTSNRSL